MPTSPSGSSSDKKNGESDGAANGEASKPPSTLARQAGNSAQRESTPQAPVEPSTDRAGEKNPNLSADGSPEGSKSSPEPATNAPGHAPPASATANAHAASAVDRWGDLPVYARDVFRAEGGSDFPPGYRQFIDAYYKRLNRAR